MQNTQNTVTIFVLAATFIVVVAILVALRARKGAKYEIRPAEIVVALVPIAVWLLLSGKVQALEFGDLKIQVALADAAKEPVDKQVQEVETLPVRNLNEATKGGVDQIDQLVRGRTEALVFQMGQGYYNGSAIREYLDRLTAHPYLKYVVVKDADGRFVGLLDARWLQSDLSIGRADADDFARAVNESDVKQLANLASWVPAKAAVRADTPRQDALEEMRSRDLTTLPVVDSDGRFVGVVEQSQLVSGLLIQVVGKVR